MRTRLASLLSCQLTFRKVLDEVVAIPDSKVLRARLREELDDYATQDLLPWVDRELAGQRRSAIQIILEWQLAAVEASNDLPPFIGGREVWDYTKAPFMLL